MNSAESLSKYINCLGKFGQNYLLLRGVHLKFSWLGLHNSWKQSHVIRGFSLFHLSFTTVFLSKEAVLTGSWKVVAEVWMLDIGPETPTGMILYLWLVLITFIAIIYLLSLLHEHISARRASRWSLTESSAADVHNHISMGLSWL